MPMIHLNPPRIYQGFIVVMIAIYLLLPATRILAFPANLLGLPVFATGAWLAIAAKRQFKADQTPVAYCERTNLLHTDRLFRYSRNPMYLGITIGLFGVAILFSSLINFFIPLLFLYVMDRHFIAREEQALLLQFGEEYLEYKRKVRRWL